MLVRTISHMFRVYTIIKNEFTFQETAFELRRKRLIVS